MVTIKNLEINDNCRIGKTNVAEIVIDEKKYPAKCVGQIAYALANGVEDDYLHPYVYTSNAIKNNVFKNLNIQYKQEKNNEQQNKSDQGENNMIKEPLNQILYGPPGTGKTFNTINKALEILEGTIPDPDKRTEAKQKFDDYIKAGQIEFVTFHQSYGYEEFVEGIKADLQSDDVKYKLGRGVFQKLSNKARENYENSKKPSQQLSQERLFKRKIAQFLSDSLETNVEFEKTRGGKFKIIDWSENTIFISAPDSQYNNNIISLDLDELTKILSSDKEIDSSRKLAKEIFGKSNQRQKDTYYFSMLNKFKESKFEEIEEIEEEENLKNYILIIDEINRGNISKIFGELITLIEPSKRIGADEALHVRLPYSNELFGVPQNLYIIGTMNTADRSIALMDTALRRRFEFSEMLPRPELVNFVISFDAKSINIKSLLETINKRIEYLYDRDHTIGHAYFMGLEDEKVKDKKAELDNIFRNKIIPLLQEYFYDDWEKILMVLGKDGFIESKVIQNAIFTYKNDEALEEEKKSYTIKSSFDYSEFMGESNANNESKN